MHQFFPALFVLISITTKAQFTEISSNTGTLTKHWKNLAVRITPAYLDGRYYTKLDDQTMIATNGKPGGTVKLSGFNEIPRIADYVATSKYLYYSIYKDGKIFLNRFDPVTQKHTPVRNSSKLFAENDESILVYSVFERKLVVSCWYYNRSVYPGKTFVYVYAIHDNDSTANAFLLAASVNEDGILDGPAGLSDDQVLTRYNLKMAGQEPKKVIYAFGFNDTLKGYYSVKKTYDFTTIGLQINALVNFGNDVLFVLNDKKKAEAKVPASSIWLLRNKSAKKLGDLTSVTSNSLSYTYKSGELLFFQFDEGVYTFNSRTGLLKNVIALQPDESLGYLTPADKILCKGDTIWCRVGTKQPGGENKYQLSWISLSKPEIRNLVQGLPSRFTTGYWWEQPAIYVPSFNGIHIYYTQEPDNTGAQLYQHSLSTGLVMKIAPPGTSNSIYQRIVEIQPLGPNLLVKALYKNGNETVTKTFLYKM